MATTSEKLPFKRVHIIGIGGAGMSGIALVLHERGIVVTGSDLKSSRYVRELEAAGIEVHVGHEAATVDAVRPDVVVVSTAIPETNPEVVRARELGIEVWPRAKMLPALSLGHTTVAVSGTHGKTTTSSMVTTMLDRMGLDPSFLIGGFVEGYDTNAHSGRSQYYVAESDESDGSFLYFDPTVAVVTNIEADHLDHYGTIENLEKTFGQFMDSVGPEGHVVACGESERVRRVAAASSANVVLYGMAGEGEFDYVCTPEPSHHSIESHLVVTTPSGVAVRVTIKANPGRHNMLNATAAIAVADVLGLDVEKAAKALSTFAGVKRRFTHVADIDGITVVDDYGHHPTEVAATLSAAAGLDYDRVVVVFQPHRYSRTQALSEQFGVAFDNADVLYVMDIFSAGEMPIPGISGKTVAAAVERLGHDVEVRYVPNRRELTAALVRDVRPGDLLVTMGAGDVTLVGPAFVEAKREADSERA